MIARIYSALPFGPIIQPVTLEFETTRYGLPHVSLIGQVRSSALESKERVFSALRSCGIKLPRARVTVNLTPVNLPKTGSMLDLPLALGLMVVFGLLPKRPYAAIGELGLDGSLTAPPGALGCLQQLYGHKEIYTPTDLAHKYGNFPFVHFSDHLSPLITAIRGESCLMQPEKKNTISLSKDYIPSIKISQRLQRVLSIVLAGKHHCLLFGSPGVGKSYTQQLLPFLLPPESNEEKMERLIQADLSQSSISEERIIAPHHSCTVAGLIGGGNPFRPGAITRAHNNILFMDEISEFSRECLECLRQPLEQENLEVLRAGFRWIVPCSFTLMATTNPCPCGYYGMNRCRCSPIQVKKYLERLSGPVLDRIDLQHRVTLNDRQTLRTDEIIAWRNTILKARQRQSDRAKEFSVPEKTSAYEEKDFNKLNSPKTNLPTYLSMRRRLKVQRVAWTLADLEESEKPTKLHFLEAMQLVGSSFLD